MNWLTNYVRPKIRALYARKEVPDNLWHKCPNCEAMLFHRDLEEHLHVCQHCGFHMRLDPLKRMAMLFDEGQYQTVELPKSVADPLKFRDQKRYTDRLKEAQAKTGRGDAIVVGHGSVGGLPAVVAAFDFGFMGGSMGIAVGEGLLTAAKLAVEMKAPLVVVPASGGARMQEGILSLMQMPRTTIAVEMVKEAGLPYLVVLTDPTTGGVTASFAMLGDVHIAEKGAQIGFAGARVIESTIRETLPEGFQRSEYLLEHGMVDMVVHRKDLRATLSRLIDLLTRPVKDEVLEPDLDIPALSHMPRAEETAQPDAASNDAPQAQAAQPAAHSADRA
ncbi:acetyl-CoA carboxylase carboxyltransferase subunit beta [Azospirillum sp. RWY-5-1]|uniref:Acetyl-coenzyme A carboxylase carboxyl transferase subunit beta n=1 Tax=Azospirillum oleiclasticum TaxID=2735135 RepID=A0ABX2T911_9PROT|nr:acetyl-CoA carboxylase, carboxyltransferase subunit beta [Azospirillum oleiclasticum]NYZ13401.1 acetyl-CoA carboxylase carboxyltransferase subunit beta [Azospirillum oleiclasticum]NYZ20562.1 acetyl-CoA carboxylase carboxyltransferase subunit beta [Azospirillum oleiclasticum]